MTGIKRALAGVAGVVLLVLAALISSGLALLVPFGVLAARARTRRRGLLLTRGTAWLGAMGAVVAGGLVLIFIAVVRLPQGTMEQMRRTFDTTFDSAMTSSRKQPPPAWLERVSPGAGARRAAVSKQPPGSAERAFMAWAGIVGAVLGVGILAAMLATLGWVGTLLIAFALRGAWYPGRQPATPVG